MPLRRILIVDDEAGIRFLLSDLLADLGFETLVAEDGERALTLVREGPPIDLAIVDLMLPGMSGLETLDALRRVTPGLKGIVSSGVVDLGPDGRGHPAVAAARARGDGVLAKPYKIDGLEAEIKRVMGGSRRP